MSDETAARLAALEARLTEIETRLDTTASQPEEAQETSPRWVIDGLTAQVPSPGAVVFAGTVNLPTGHWEYQWTRTTDHVTQTDWAERADRISALGHPLRLTMLRLLLDGDHTVAQLVDALDLGSSGVAYHHLNQLATAGWITSPRRGEWSIPPARIVPLMTIITATEGP